ncbi:MAG: sulfatase-like hydrolase/transferase [Candidatus Eisenbacteria bacterium]
MTLAVMSLFLGACGEPGPKLVLLLVVDTLRADRLGCYGYDEIETPNIDRLAADGVLYENAMTAVPVTLPSMSTIFTGTYPPQHGVRDNGSYELSDSWTTLAEALKARDFATGAFVSAAVLDPVHNLTQGFDVYDADVSMYYRPYSPLLTPIDDEIQGIERRAEVTVDRALAWLRTQDGTDALLVVHLFDPHLPRDPPPPFRDQYAGREYEGEIAYADQEVGRLLAGVEELRDPDDTLVVFLSDHGEGLGEHGETLHGDLLHEATTRVPLIVRGPGLPRGRRVPELVRTVDVFPTVCAYLDLPAPTPTVGSPLAELGLDAIGPSVASPRFRTTAYLETFRPRLTHGWCELRGLRTERWKLIDGPRYELYDLRDDPHEQVDVADAEPAVRDSLAKLLDRVALLAAHQGVSEAGVVEIDDEMAEKLMSLGYVTPRGRRISSESGGERTVRGGQKGFLSAKTQTMSPESLAVWLYPPDQRGRALDLPHPGERVQAAQDRIVARSFYTSALGLLEAGNAQEAAARFRIAFEKSPRFTEAYLGFVDAALLAGQREAAIECLGVAKRELPADEQIAARLAKLLEE